MNSPSVCLFLFSLSSILLVGYLWKRDNLRLDGTDRIKEGDEVTMEVDLRSSTPSERTLFWCVNKKPQKYYITHLPQKVEFGVCPWLILSLSSTVFIRLLCYGKMMRLNSSNSQNWLKGVWRRLEKRYSGSNMWRKEWYHKKKWWNMNMEQYWSWRSK